ncbi:archaemetzincin-2 isoform X2 [Chelonoidis abingdonii]|uniref:archaemetzincin-2 isoform X2 n=1 Tax=Chelonoidis abingdonii TaxID=106734 RepID=UPI0013F270B5|nr:archaemetzincin-2 isoform X2 [Chelonoidis abingdonii]
MLLVFYLFPFGQMKVIEHSEQVLRMALISKNTQLVKLYENLESREKCLLNEAFQPDSVLFRPITLHSESDWISSHPEPTQDFEQFYNDPYRSRPTSQKSTIYVQPIGSFGDTKVSTEDYMKWLKDYCEAFYYGLSVKILEPVPVSHTGCAFRVNEYTCNLQIHAGMGIFSFARYDSDFYSASYKGRLKRVKKLPSADYSVFDGYYTPAINSMLLLRSCKTLTHEIGHIFGLHHCQWLQCVMQGSNHLEESDRRPLDLCPICLRKLQSAIGFHIVERYQALLGWMDEDDSGMDAEFRNEAKMGLLKPVEAFKEYREWVLKCLDVLQK